MDKRQLEIFCTVARKKSFSLAGEALGLAQPSISFQIASLEKEFGTRLFDRGGRSTLLTRSGEVLYQYARQILELAAEAEQAIGKLEGLLWGEVVLGASTIPGEYILPRILPRFKESHPGIAINMLVGDTRGVIKKVIENEAEIGVVGASERNDKLTFTPFVTDRMVLIAPAENRWFASGKATLEELRKAPFIMREDGSGTRVMILERLREVDLNLDELNVAMTLGSTTAVKKAVEAGAGVGILSERAVENEVKLGLVRKVDIEGVELDRQFYLLHRKQKVLSPAGEALLQFLTEHGKNSGD